jgi:hypothetical protein
VLGGTIVVVAAPKVEWAVVWFGAILVVGDGATALLNQRR